jgi:hypothetical protein
MYLLERLPQLPGTEGALVLLPLGVFVPLVVALVAYEFRRRWGRTPPTDRVLAVPDRPDAEALRRDPGAD